MVQSQVERHAAPWIERLARFGYAAKGVVYGLLGLLAVQAAFNLGSGGKTTGSEGVLKTVARQPFGQTLLLFIGIGLAGYVVWRLVQAINDPEHDGDGWDDFARRLGYAFSGVAYAGLAWSAVKLALGGSSSNEQSSSESAATILMQQPFGRWTVGTLGAFVIGLGCYYFYRAIGVKFRSKLLMDDLSQSQKHLLIQICRFGIAARGFVFLVIGGFFIQSAIAADPEKARSTGGALSALESSPYGVWILGVVALGLIAYGIYMVAMSRYRRIQLV